MGAFREHLVMKKANATLPQKTLIQQGNTLNPTPKLSMKVKKQAQR
jgi:hypothetical protein